MTWRRPINVRCLFLLSCLIWAGAEGLLPTPPALGQEEAPIDLWLVVDVSNSINIGEGYGWSIREFKEHMRGQDRLTVYVFAESVCEVRGDPIAVIDDFQKRGKGGALPRECAAEVGSPDKTGLLRVLQQLQEPKLRRGFEASLDKGDVDRRKRAIVFLTDGVDDPEDKYNARKSREDNSKQLKDDYERREKYTEARESLLKLRKLTRQGIHRYFDVALLWIWSPLDKQIFDEAAQSQVKDFWERILNPKDHKQPILSQFLTEKERFIPWNHQKLPDDAKAAAKQIIEKLRAPRSLRIRAECLPPCLARVEKPGTTPLPSLTIFVESTYEVPMPKGAKELRFYGRKEKASKPRSFHPREAIENDLQPITESGPGSTRLRWERIHNWYVDEENDQRVDLFILGARGNGEDGRALTTGKGKTFLVEPGEIDITQERPTYTLNSLRRLRFIAGDVITMEFGVYSSLLGKIQAVAGLAGKNFENPISDPIRPIRYTDPTAPGQIRVWADFPLDRGVLAGAFKPMLVHTDSETWLAKKGAEVEPIIVVRTFPWALWTALTVYVILLVLRFGELVYVDLLQPPAGWLYIILEAVGILAYLIGVRIVEGWLLPSREVWLQADAFRLYGGSFAPFVFSFPITPLVIGGIVIIIILIVREIRKESIPVKPPAEAALLPWGQIVQSVLAAWLVNVFIAGMASAIVVGIFALIIWRIVSEWWKKPRSIANIWISFEMRLFHVVFHSLTILWLGYILWDVY